MRVIGSRSLKSKILLLIFSCIIIITAAASIVAFKSMSDILDDNIASKMNYLCRSEGFETDQRFIRIEDAVNTISVFIQNAVEQPERLKDEGRRKELVSRIDTLFSSITQQMSGIIANYVSFDPDLIDGIDGFIYSMNKKGLLEKVPLTDIRVYDSDDIEHVGWFYIPVRNKRGTWMDPYYNQNLNFYMFSYVVPVFKNGQLICIVGIDVDFTVMVDSVERISRQESRYAYLKSADGSIHYHPDFFNGDRHGDEVDEIRTNKYLMEGQNSGEKIIRYRFKGQDRVMTFVTLHNGMKLVLCDSYNAVYGERIQALITILVCAVVLGTIFILITVQLTRHITKPLENLTEAAHKLAAGDLEITLPTETDDEIGVLVRGFRTTVAHLKKYTSNMETLAYQDAMTKVKNSSSYKLATENLEKQIQHSIAEFAVVMCDLNYLKYINDHFGHKAGDTAIKIASGIICRSFPYSTVFRIGGDEFVVILQGIEYEKRDELCAALEREIAENAAAKDSEEYAAVSIAYGMAVYEPDRDRNYQQVFERADAKMYEHKERLHKERGLKSR